MSHSTYYLPYSFAHPFQDPKSRSEGQGPSTAGGPTTGSPTTGTATTVTPSTGTQGDPAAGKTAQPQGPCAGDTMMYMLPLMLVLMYFMIFRPEQKRKKQQATLMSAIKVGERIVMLSGMHGVISSLTDKTVTVRAGDANITFDRTAVARVVRDEPATPPAK